MTNEIYENSKFLEVMKQNVENIINFLIEEEIEFSVTANVRPIGFEPFLPDDIYARLGSFALFSLAGYTFSTTRLTEDGLVFDAGFGPENFGSIVTIPTDAIFQILVDEEIFVINPTATKLTVAKPRPSKDKSKNIFKSNPNNKNLFS